MQGRLASLPTLSRRLHREAIARLFEVFPVVALLGARQVGKSTLARAFARRSRVPVEFLDLEDPEERRRLADPGLVLRDLRGLVVLDEVQAVPDLFPLLRVLADRPGRPASTAAAGLGRWPTGSGRSLRRSSSSASSRCRVDVVERPASRDPPCRVACGRAGITGSAAPPSARTSPSP
jgi:hypothetical protein